MSTAIPCLPSTIQQADRFEAFRESVSNTFVPLQVERVTAQPFDGWLRSVDLGALKVTGVGATPHRVRRTPTLIARSDPEYYKLGVQLQGRCTLSQAGRETCLTAGDSAIYDTSRPYTMTFDGPYRQLVVMFPRPLLCLPDDRIRAITARRVPGDQGLGALLHVLVREIAYRLDELTERTDIRLADTIVNLVATVYADQLDGGTPGHAAGRKPLMSKVVSYIERHLDEAELTPKRIADENHISTRYLHKLFHEESATVTSWIRTRRLEHCRRELRDPARRDRSIGVIAAHWGFADPANFSRVFRNAYGISPREYRAATDDYSAEKTSRP
ncbi:helix-turn-helix domain-containing protein [Nocardia sp. NPDC020380]|uniref:AraC-like ligand-binding domain-containing protein n=1 Tax=Nocardia sp. NPDC020380 TaxID=3364309 RepID=UPI0037905FFF